MQEDFFPAAEKILFDIENVLKRDPNLVGFEIIPGLDNENKSPVLHAENSLGLASWSVKPLYCYTYNQLLQLRQNRTKREDPSTVSRWLLGALLLNPDVTTFWNMRRELVRNGRLEWEGELHFVAVVLYYKAKCFEAFAYRRWLLQYILAVNAPEPLAVELILEKEVGIASMSADRYANNYHAWNHREYVVSTFQAHSPQNFGQFLEAEWQRSAKWSSLHISDYSGFAYRQFLLKHLLRIESNAGGTTRSEATCREILAKYLDVHQDTPISIFSAPCERVLSYLHDIPAYPSGHKVDDRANLTGLSYWAEESLFNEELLNLYPGHEAFWYHRRFLSHLLIVLTTSYEKYFAYRIELVDEKMLKMPDTKLRATAHNPLESAYQTRNRDLIARAKDVGGHQNVMGERFAKFLFNHGLQL